MKKWVGFVLAFAVSAIVDHFFGKMMAVDGLVLAGPAALPILAIAAVAGTGYQVYSGERARSEANKERENQKREAERLRKEFSDRQAQEESTAAAKGARAQARRRQLALSTSGQSRQDTILTQGLGTIGQPQTQQNTLLGA